MKYGIVKTGLNFMFIKALKKILRKLIAIDKEATKKERRKKDYFFPPIR